MCDTSPSLEFTGFRVRREKMGFTVGLSVLVAMRMLQVRGPSKRASLCQCPKIMPEVLQGFNFVDIMTMFFYA